MLDALLGTDARRGRRDAPSSHLAGDLGSRASRALDGDPATAWQSAFGPQDGQHLTDRRCPRRRRCATCRWTVVVDDRHSVPGSLTLLADGEVVGTVAVPPSADGRTVAGGAPGPAGRPPDELRDRGATTSRPVTPVPGDPSPAEILPVAIAELQGDGLPQAVDPAAVDGTLPGPLLAVDGDGGARCGRSGPVADARAGLALEACDGPLDLAAGPTSIDVRPSVSTWASTSTGWSSAPTPTAHAGAARRPGVRPERRRRDGGGDRSTTGHRLRPRPRAATVRRSGSCWVRATTAGGSSTSRAARSGPARSSTATPTAGSSPPTAPGELTASLRWDAAAPGVDHARRLGHRSCSCCIVILVRTRRRPASDGARAALPDPGRAGRRASGAHARARRAGGGGGGWACSSSPRRWRRCVASVAVVVGLLVPRATWVWAALAPALVLASRRLERPELAWVALALLASDLVGGGLDQRARSGAGVHDGIDAGAPAR